MIRILLIVSLLSSPLWLIAQHFNGGLLAGASATQVDGDGHGGYNRLGGIAGAWVSYSINQNIYLRTELKFIQKGSYKKFSDEFGGILGLYSLRLNYVEMPFLIEYHFRDDFIPFAGFSFGYLWKAIESDANGSYPSDDIAMFRKFESTGIAGVEYVFSSSFSFCAAFSYSVYPVRPHKGNITYRLNQGQYNNALQFYFRYHF
jgi:hypothetical protein